MTTFPRRTVFTLAFVACLAIAGCGQTGPRTTLKSPSDLIRDAAFGRGGLTNSEYGGSDHAREWAMQEKAFEQQQQMQQFATGQFSSAEPPQ